MLESRQDVSHRHLLLTESERPPRFEEKHVNPNPNRGGAKVSNNGRPEGGGGGGALKREGVVVVLGLVGFGWGCLGLLGFSEVCWGLLMSARAC